MIEVDLNKDKIIIHADEAEKAIQVLKKIEASKNKLLFMDTEDFIIVRNCK